MIYLFIKHIYLFDIYLSNVSRNSDPVYEIYSHQSPRKRNKEVIKFIY